MTPIERTEPEHQAPMDIDAPIVSETHPLDMSEADYAHWLLYCNRGLGGSAMAALLDLHPWTDRLKVWQRFFGVGTPAPMTKRMLRGIELETLAAKAFERETGCELIYPGPYMKHKRLIWAVGHPDGIITFHPGRNKPGVLEIKCPGEDNTRKQIEDGVSKHYIIQVNHYMGIGEMEWAAFNIFDGNAWTSHTPEFEFDPELWQQMEDAGQTFYERHIVTREPPEVAFTPDEQEALRSVSIQSVGAEAVTLTDPAHLRIFDRLLGTTEQKKLAGISDKNAREAMQAVMEEVDADFVKDGTGKKVYWREVTSKRFNKKALLEAHPEIDEAAFTEQTVTRPMKVYG